MNKFINIIFSRGLLLCSIRNPDNSVFLTFDDGPHPEYTERILDILDRCNVKATFFLVGEKMEKHPHLVKKILESGHQIGNHSHVHKRESDILKGILKAEDIIKAFSGKTDRIFRPPWGRVSIKILVFCLIKKIRIILWSFDSGDHKFGKASDIISRIKNEKIRQGDIILMHEDYKITVEALPEFINIIKAEGYNFKKINYIDTL